MKEQLRNCGGYVDYLPVVGKLRRQIDREVKEIGFQQTFAKWAVVAGESKLSVIGKDRRLKEILQNKPGVVVINHPSYAEIITIVASLEPRDDLYLVGISNFLGFGPNFSEHVVPIYMTEQMARKPHKLPVRLGNMLRFGPRVSFKSAHTRNIESINKTAEIVRNGGLTVMFPEGVQSGRNKRWFNGIGYLLSDIGTEIDAYLVFAHSRGTSGWDCLRLAPGVKNILSQASITFSEPRNIASVLGQGGDARIITERLKKDYKTWSRSLGKR